MTSAGRLASKEEFAFCGRQERFAVDIGVSIYTRAKERECA